MCFGYVLIILIGIIENYFNGRKRSLPGGGSEGRRWFGKYG